MMHKHKNACVYLFETVGSWLLPDCFCFFGVIKMKFLSINNYYCPIKTNSYTVAPMGLI